MASVLHTRAGKDGFRLRGIEMSRVDGFSDVVFGFALTLLVVSLEVPKTYAELHELLRGFLPFAVSFLLLMTIWWEHYLCFRRYGLDDALTVVLNAALLFVVLFYVYPLKFLFGMVVGEIMGTQATSPFANQHQVVELMVVYGLGFMAIYLLLAALYWNGWRHRDELELTPLERILARGYILDSLGSATVGLISCVLAVSLPERVVGLAGYSYLLMGASKTFFGFYERRQIQAEKARIAPASIPQSVEPQL
jgi:uncharacterized membrane protein